MAEVIVALDRPSAPEALALVERLPAEGAFYKVGLELFIAAGPNIVRDLQERGARVFLDLKLHDIPNTVGEAARRAAALGVDLLTVHASGGRRMLESARSAVEGSPTQVLAVTVLTSLTGEELQDGWGRRERLSVEEEVLRLAARALEWGAHGLVASPVELRGIRQAFGTAPTLVAPGIRLQGDDAHDQRRVSTPEEAAAAGADYLVIGRSITGSPDPARALERCRPYRVAGGVE